MGEKLAIVNPIAEALGEPVFLEPPSGGGIVSMEISARVGFGEIILGLEREVTKRRCSLLICPTREHALRLVKSTLIPVAQPSLMVHSDFHSQCLEKWKRQQFLSL